MSVSVAAPPRRFLVCDLSWPESPGIFSLPSLLANVLIFRPARINIAFVSIQNKVSIYRAEYIRDLKSDVSGCQKLFFIDHKPLSLKG